MKFEISQKPAKTGQGDALADCLYAYIEADVDVSVWHEMTTLNLSVLLIYSRSNTPSRRLQRNMAPSSYEANGDVA